MTAPSASAAIMSTDDGTRQQGVGSPTCPVGSEPVAGEMELTMRDIDFSRVNLQYLISARDLARRFPERASLLLGVSDDLTQLLAGLDPAALVTVIEVKAPLLVLHQEPWWWKRLFAALQVGRPDELGAVLEQAGLVVASGGPPGPQA
jgi:hypothetical protein